MKLRTLFAVCFALFVAVSSLAEPHRPKAFPKRAGGPAMSFEETAIVLTGATGGATLYVAGVSFAPGYQTVVQSEAGVVTADAAGAARYVTRQPVETRGLWIAVDAATGGYTVAAPPGMLRREMDFPGNAPSTGGGALRRFLLADRWSIEAILIRPSQGMWAATLRDGVTRDAGGTIDGTVDLDIATLASVGKAPPAPDRMMPGDLLVLIDRVTLEYHVAVLGH